MNDKYYMDPKRIAPARLLELKKTLYLMVGQGRMDEAEALSILRKAGFARLPEADGWIDEEGAIYR